MAAPQITIGLPCYMAEKTLAQAIESVLNQTYEDFELLLVDDGSEDGTLEIARTYQDVRIRIIVDGEHRGIAARLNMMVREAQGRIFARMDADDIMMPNRLERQQDFLSQHPEADVVGCAAVVMDVDGMPIGTRETGAYGYKLVSRLLHPTIMGRTDWFRQNPYDERYSGCEDYELWLRVRGKATLLQMDEPLMCYRDKQTYDVHKVWRERTVGLKMIWNERRLFGSAWRMLLQIAINVIVMVSVPIIHALHLDSWVISKRNTDFTN